ncbi:MAG TPA: YggT family protein [bacterium]|nr:YggT family protein [bacterium]
MFIFGELFNSLAFLINGICTILFWLLFARIIVSWLPVDPYHSVVLFLVQVTDPILLPFRRLPLQVGMFDLTPMVAFAALYFINRVLVRICLTLAYQLGGG